MLEPFFFNTANGARLFGVWREPRGENAPQEKSRAVWVVCGPFAEEEKSARRTLAEGCETLRVQGDASLLFSYRGTGDSEGDFALATLAHWRQDIRAACAEARRRAPDAPLHLLGLRLGASLAAQVAHETDARRLVLIEPLLNGRRYLSEMGQRKKLRAMMTSEEQKNTGANSVSNGALSSGASSNGGDSVHSANHSANHEGARRGAAAALALGVEDMDVEDMDGWPIAPALRDEINALDLPAQPPVYEGETRIYQIGPREQIAPPLARFAETLNAPCRAVVMRPFWNLLDYTRSDALWQQIQKVLRNKG